MTREISLSKSHPSHALGNRLHVWAAERRHFVPQLAYKIPVAIAENGAQRSYKLFHCLLLKWCRYLAAGGGIHEGTVALSTSGTAVMACPVVQSTSMYRKYGCRIYQPSALHAFRVTVSHVVPQMVFALEHFTLIDL